MRTATLVTAALMAAPLVAAEDVGTKEKTRLVEPQVVFSIEHVEGMGDFVQMHYVGDFYDEPAVKEAVAGLAGATGAQISNYQFIPTGTPGEVNKVSFVTHGLIDVSTSDIRLQPLVRAFMQGANGTVESFSVRIVGIRPSAYTTLAAYSSRAVALRAFYDAATPSIEYRILLLTKVPEEVVIPPRHIPDEMVTQSFEAPGDDRTPLLLGLVALASLSAGALVYFAMLGRRH